MSEMRVGAWQQARIVARALLTPSILSFTLQPQRPFMHVAGQHVDLRLTAADGYRAQRSYSVASAPGTALEVAIERLDDGEVSPYFHDIAQVGDEIEMRGPIGGHFIWRPDDGDPRPLLCVGGGSGIVPLVSMVRARARVENAARVPAALLFSARSAEHLAFIDELDALAAVDPGLWVQATLTRQSAPLPTGRRSGRVDSAWLQTALDHLGGVEVCAYVCGRNAFVEVVAQALISLGVAAQSVRTERYGG